MKIAIFSDSHDNIPNLERVLTWLKTEGISLIIHCGDIVGYEFLEKMANSFSGNIYFTTGNADDMPLTKFKSQDSKIKFCDKVGEIKIDDRNIAFTHFPDKAKELAGTGRYDLIFYGHSHKPWLEKLEVRNKKTKTVQLVNPGNLAALFYKATFAIFDTKTGKLELKIVENLT